MLVVAHKLSIRLYRIQACDAVFTAHDDSIIFCCCIISFYLQIHALLHDVENTPWVSRQHHTEFHGGRAYADVHPCGVPAVSEFPGHLNLTTASNRVHTQAVMKARDIIEVDFDAIAFADDAEVHADLNTREDIIHSLIDLFLKWRRQRECCGLPQERCQAGIASFRWCSHGPRPTERYDR